MGDGISIGSVRVAVAGIVEIMGVDVADSVGTSLAGV